MHQHASAAPSAPRSSSATKLHSFDEALRSEADFAVLLQEAFQHPSVEVVDVSKDPAFQKRGVDFEYCAEGKRVWLDDKADSWTSGNCAIEFCTKTAWGELVPGWAFSSHMAWLRYSFTKTGDCFLFPMQEIREHLLPRLREFQPASAVNGWKATGKVRHITFSALVPLRELMKACPGALHVSLGKELGRQFEGATLLPLAQLPRSVSAEEALLAMLAGNEQCAPMTPELGPWWNFGCAKDRVRGNAWAIAALAQAGTRAGGLGQQVNRQIGAAVQEAPDAAPKRRSERNNSAPCPVPSLEAPSFV